MPKFVLKMKSQWSNVKLKSQTVMKFYEIDIHRKLMKKESNETKIKIFRIKIREKSLFQNQQKSAPKFGRNDEKFDF